MFEKTKHGMTHLETIGQTWIIVQYKNVLKNKGNHLNFANIFWTI